MSSCTCPKTIELKPDRLVLQPIQGHHHSPHTHTRLAAHSQPSPWPLLGHLSGFVRHSLHGKATENAAMWQLHAAGKVLDVKTHAIKQCRILR